jgi:hypothetical protein
VKAPSEKRERERERERESEKERERESSYHDHHMPPLPAQLLPPRGCPGPTFSSSSTAANLKEGESGIGEREREREREWYYYIGCWRSPLLALAAGCCCSDWGVLGVRK